MQFFTAENPVLQNCIGFAALRIPPVPWAPPFPAVDVEQESSPAMGWKMEILQIFNFPPSLNPLATISIQ